MNPKVDFYFDKAGKWQEEIIHLRTILLDCGLTEELKWGTPCYTNEGNNIVLIHTFKAYCAILFFRGAQLSDQKGILIQQTKNVQLARQIRFTNIREVLDLTSDIKNYIKQAIEIEKAGVTFDFKKTEEFPVPEEFDNMLKAIPELKTAFYKLTPGRQRAYLLHFAAPKQIKTRSARIEKYMPLILKGKGLNDN